jgi:hypothetical protein
VERFTRPSERPLDPGADELAPTAEIRCRSRGPACIKWVMGSSVQSTARVSRSCSLSASASWTRSPPRQSITIIARSLKPWASSLAWRITHTISSTVGGSAG